MAESTPATAMAKEQLAKSKELRTKIVEETEKTTNAKPTPTQEENDRAKLGEDVSPKEPDGSGPSPEFHVTKVVEADKDNKQAYATRQQQAKPPAQSS